jgi:hypothetical protein
LPDLYCSFPVTPFAAVHPILFAAVCGVCPTGPRCSHSEGDEGQETSADGQVR